MGAFRNHATTASEYAAFDNIYATASCTLGAEPTTLTNTSATLSGMAGSGAARLVVMRRAHRPHRWATLEGRWQAPPQLPPTPELL